MQECNRVVVREVGPMLLCRRSRCMSHHVLRSLIADRRFELFVDFETTGVGNGAYKAALLVECSLSLAHCVFLVSLGLLWLTEVYSCLFSYPHQFVRRLVAISIKCVLTSVCINHFYPAVEPRSTSRMVR